MNVSKFHLKLKWTKYIDWVKCIIIRTHNTTDIELLCYI